MPLLDEDSFYRYFATLARGEGISHEVGRGDTRCIRDCERFLGDLLDRPPNIELLPVACHDGIRFVRIFLSEIDGGVCSGGIDMRAGGRPFISVFVAVAFMAWFVANHVVIDKDFGCTETDQWTVVSMMRDTGPSRAPPTFVSGIAPLRDNARF